MARFAGPEKIDQFNRRTVLMRPCRHSAGFVFIACATILLLAVACTNKQEQAQEKVVYRLKWLFNISVVGDLYAEHRGFFAAQGLDVEIKPGSPERDAIKELELGRAQFGVASADQVIRALEKGAPIVVIAQLFQKNPLQWLYRTADVTIRVPQDLKGRTIGITLGGNDETIMRALLTRYGIAQHDVDLYSVRYDYTPFYQRQVDLWPVYQNAEGIVIAGKLGQEGETVRFFNPDAFGIRFVANSIVTTRQMLQDQPETVAKFLAVLLRGWQEALDPANATLTLKTLQMFDKDTPLEILHKQLEATRKLMTPRPGTALGTIDVAAWRQTERIMLEQRLIADPVGVENYLHQASTIFPGGIGKSRRK
jgi:NitT/TauT family transport system substrate-binding protein